MKKILLTSFLSFAIFFATGSVFVHGQGNVPNPPPTGNVPNSPGVSVTLTNPFSGPDSLFALLEAVINDILLPIGGVLAVLAFIYSGFLYVMAQGNESKLATAHKALLYTSIGTAVLLGSWVLANVIFNTIPQIN